MKRMDKIKAWVNVLSFLLLSGTLHLLSFIIYPISYLLYGKLKKWHNIPGIKWITFPLWVFNSDDEGDLYGNEFECWRNINVWPTNWINKFICSYYWNVVRNPSWNIYRIFKFSGEKSDYHCEKSVIYNYSPTYLGLKRAGKVNSYPIETLDYRMKRAKFFYINDTGVKTESTNVGDFIDFEKSLFGKSFYYFRRDQRWWVMWSTCRITRKDDNGLMHIREINIGADSRVLLRNKWQQGRVCHFSNK